MEETKGKIFCAYTPIYHKQKVEEKLLTLEGIYKEKEKSKYAIWKETDITQLKSM